MDPQNNQSQGQSNQSGNMGQGMSPKDNNMLMGVLSYLGPLVLIPLLTSKNDPSVKFHVKQGLVLLIGEVIGSVIVAVPIFGWILSPLIWLASVILVIMGIMNAANGQMKELPLIGHFAKNFNF